MTHINQRRDLSTAWASANPVLHLGEVGWEIDTRKSKLGDGATAWNDLPYTVADVVVTKADLGLDQVDNTRDLDKPVSSAQQALIVNSIANGDITHAPSRNAVYNALKDQIAPTVVDSDTTHSPSGNAVHDAIAAATVGVCPTGAIIAFAMDGNAPAGWARCLGQELSRTNYAALFAVIGTTYGAGDGSTTFNAPNLRGRVLAGIDTADTDFAYANKKGGAKITALGVANLPSHNHTMTHSHATTSSGTDGGSTLAFRRSDNANTATNGGMVSSFTGNTGNTGSGAAFSNLPPYVAVSYLIKL